MHKRHFATLLAICLCLQSSGAATTVVVAVTPKGIVIGADGKIVGVAEDMIPTETRVKIFLLKKHLIVAGIGNEKAMSGDTGRVLYNFQDWVKKIDAQTDSKVSVGELAKIISNQMTTTFDFAVEAIKSGKLTKEQARASGVDPTFVEYIVAGYEKGVPTAYSIALVPDWSTRTLNGPFKVLLHPADGKDVNSRIFARGHYSGFAFALAGTENTNEQKRLATRVPVEFSLLGKHHTLSLDQASNMVRALLGIEADTEPQYVSFPITLVTVPITGDGWVRAYTKDVSRLSYLPKSNAGARPVP
jgi:hypothetical protein